MGGLKRWIARWILAWVAMFCAFLLVGCQGQNTNDGITHLTLWQGVNPPPNRDVLDRLVQTFNQTHPDIQVRSIYIGQGDQQIPKILAAIVGDAAPDLLWYAPTLTGQLVDLEALHPVEADLLNSKLLPELDPALLGTMEYDGHLWSVPFSTNNVGIYYRPSLFQSAGVKPPKTWAEFRRAAKELTLDRDGDGKIDQRGMVLPLGKGEWTVFTWLPFMWSAGGDLQTSGRVNTPGSIAALEFWQGLVKDGSAVLSAPERGYELDGLISGKVAMQLSGPWTLAQLQASPAAQDFAVLPLPQDKTPATIVGGENLFLFKAPPKRQQAAFTFAEYVLSEAFQTDWAIHTGYLPVNLKSRRSAEYKAFKVKQPQVQVFLDQAFLGRSRPISPGYNRISDSLGRAIESVLLDRQTPKRALAEAQRRLDLVFPKEAVEKSK
jgi:multiple sugar transport system substrate-binding protein